MASSKRRCATCRHFQDAGMSGTGWCTHPKRQLSSDVRILVRPAELACRNSWGNDFWEDKDSAGESVAAKPRREADHQPPTETSQVQISFEDEVTSVVSSESHRSRSADDLNDHIVEQSIRPDDDFDTGHNEQNERIDLLARNSRTAIERARERHLLRRNPEPMSHDEVDIVAGSVPATPAFEPDDFVEEETPSREDDSRDAKHPTDDDVVLSEGAGVTSPRSRRLRRSREKASRPKREPLPEPDEDDPATSHDVRAESGGPAPDERDRFNSIPDISADFELPRLRRNQQPDDENAPVARSIDAVKAPELENPYDVALNRAQAIKAAARAERQERLTHERRPLAPLRSGSVRQEHLGQSAETERRPIAPVRVNGFDAEAEGVSDHTPSPDRHEESPVRTRRPIAPIPAERQPYAPFDEPKEDPADIISNNHVDDIAKPERATFPAEPYPKYSEDEYLAARGIRARRHPDSEAPARPPEAKRNWWRGIFQERPDAGESQQPQPVHASSMYSDDDQWMDEPDEITDVYAVTYDDTWEAEDDVAGTEEDIRTESGFEQEYDHLVSQANDAYVNEDEPELTHVAWRDEDARPEYEPLNLAEERDMDAFRNRLFATATAGTVRAADRSEGRAAAQRSPVSMSRGRTPDVQHRVRHAESIQPETLLDDPSDAYYEPEMESGFDLRNLVGPDLELLDMTIEVAPGVPRNCATCRSYRVSEQGGRGWCTNTWAFTHRQMVNAEDLPCQSTIGCWWLPADNEVWLEDAELTYPETPRVDRLIAHLDPLKRAVGR